MVIQLAAVGAVQPVVEVVPPAALAPCAPHDRSDANSRRTYDETPGLCNDAHALWQSRESRANRGAEAPYLRRLASVGDWKSSADIERVESSQALTPSGSEQERTRRNRLDVLARVCRLGADVEG